MIEQQQAVKPALQALFAQARSNGDVNFIFTLVRLTGLGHSDEILELHAKLQSMKNGVPDQNMLASYKTLLDYEEPLCLLANLINCLSKKHYDAVPFLHLRTGDFPNYVKPSIIEIIRELVKAATNINSLELVQILLNAYPEAILEQLGENPPVEPLRYAFTNCCAFLNTLLELYSEERLSYLDKPKILKLPDFQILELITDSKYGLCGFRVHFSDDATSTFIRRPDNTDCENLTLGPPVVFYCSGINPKRDEWRIGGKRLHEIGLPGRYNKLGEWKPMIYPGETKQFIQEAESLSQDRDVRNCLYYIMCTGHRIIEFAAKTTLDLPLKDKVLTLGEKFHLWKCLPLEEHPSFLGQNYRIYDGWLDLDSISPPDIEKALDTIGFIMNTLAFTYSAPMFWRIKYGFADSFEPALTPTEDDLTILMETFRNFPSDDEAIILSAAMDWYIRGRSSTNVFNEFLSYYVAMESVAIAISDGKATFGLKDIPTEMEAEKKKRVAACIKEKYESLYSTDPVKFIQDAYFDCVLSLKKKLRDVAQIVFGEKHPYLEKLFKKDPLGKPSLSDIRSGIAHGGLTLTQKQDLLLVGEKVFEMGDISKEFLNRIIFRLKPIDSPPTWSNKFAASISFSDPRTTLNSTHESIFPNKDWHIRPEWVE